MKVKDVNKDFHENYIKKALSHLYSFYLTRAKLCFLVFLSNSDGFTSTSSDGEILEDMDEDDLAIFQMMHGNDNFSNEFFFSHEMEERASQFMNPNVGV
jgi:hypothetical protein